MKIILKNDLQISEAPEALLRKFRDTFTIENPVWLENYKMKRWQGRTDHWLTFFKKQSGVIEIPRGAMGLIIFFCKEINIRYVVIDKRRKLPSVDFTFKGTLKGYQKRAVRDILVRDFNVLQAGTGTGKTIIALYVIAERKQPVLIIVHSKELLAQWINRIEQFLDIPRDKIGIIGNGKKRIGEKITVAIINSLYPIAEEVKDFFGHIVVDECHRTPSRTFTEAVSAFDCQYMLGLSATPYRRDGLTPLISWYLGRKFEVNQAELTENDIIKNVEVIIRKTNFVTDYDPSEEYSQMLSELTEDNSRNLLIVGDIIEESSNSVGVCLVLTDRKEHCRTLADMLNERGISVDILTGEVSNGERQAIVGRLSAGMVKILIATGQLIGEGFDAKSLQTLFLTTPIKFDGRLFQYLGRIIRPAPGKDYARIYDYIDANVGVLAASARARQKVYQQIIVCK